MRCSNCLIAFICVVLFFSTNKVAIGSEISDGKYKFDKEKNIELGHKPDDVTVMLQIFPWITIKNNKLIISAGECILPSKKMPLTFDCFNEKQQLEFLQGDNSLMGEQAHSPSWVHVSLVRSEPVVVPLYALHFDGGSWNRKLGNTSLGAQVDGYHGAAHVIPLGSNSIIRLPRSSDPAPMNSQNVGSPSSPKPKLMTAAHTGSNA